MSEDKLETLNPVTQLLFRNYSALSEEILIA
jgi:hypothetical protein